MLFRREFKRNLRSLIIWSIIIAGIILMYLSIFPSMAKEQANMDNLVNAVPEGMQKAFGMDRLSLGTLLGFYGIEIHLMTTLLGSIYAALLASGIIAKEQNEKTAEFLLALPISRRTIIAQKGLAVLANVLLFNFVIVVSSLIGFQFASDQDLPYKAFFLLELAVLMMHLTFAGIAFLFSAVARRTRSIVSVSLGTVFVMYFLSVVAGISERLSWLKYVSPFKYADSAQILTESRFHPLYAVIMGVVIAGCFLSAYWYYSKKDIAV
ncbi:ABC transporter permease subunit [Paenibacillus sacheonensis]|uniref:ABC transporter permease subunit n=1 Tax=Paenibacillus sacheonensis TaxID=742054 RepID=A0A7X5C435_9BACL|nr:ABC transporter permease subunit [Paenibacillus sacheonensis]MBM7568040.1 ABC-2 type transport system permease protein [Paenibacillus sacheonensis]NBC72930.1 ABC transporter permease subunit [Paenibacillus sacheonensis]